MSTENVTTFSHSNVTGELTIRSRYTGETLFDGVVDDIKLAHKINTATEKAEQIGRKTGISQAKYVVNGLS